MAGTFARMAALLLAVAVIGWLDYLSGPRFSLSLFYLLPVALAGWYLSIPAAVVIAVAASLGTFEADLFWSSSAAEALWNGATSLIIFLAAVSLLSRLRQGQRDLKTAAQREARLARIDPVTTLPNSRAFNELLNARMNSGEDPSSVAVYFIDLDDFKSVNDQLGHAVGDDVLQKTAEVIAASIRSGDVAARLGGDEFGILATGLTRETAEEIARRILGRIDEVSASYPGTNFGATVGVAWAPQFSGRVPQLIDAADKAMYEGKEKGKRRIVVRDVSPDLMAGPEEALPE